MKEALITIGNYLSSLDMFAVSQTLIAIGSLILLIKTLSAQRNANESQIKLLELEKLSKRAENMPAYNVHVGIVHKSFEAGRDGIPIPSDECSVYYKMTVKDNLITKFRVECTNPDENILKLTNRMDHSYAFYKKDDRIEESVLDLNYTDIDAIRAERDGSILQTVLTLRFEDILGNKYLQSVIYDLISQRMDILPLSTD